jgi:hypothetical protein
MKTIRFSGVPSSHSFQVGHPFPAHARGFFYLHNPLEQASIASSIRFRCTSSDNPSEFSHGKDLVRPNGLVWEYPLTMVLSETSPATCIRDYLLHAQIISDEQVARWQSVVNQSAHIMRDHQGPRVLRRLNQPFPIKFQYRQTYINAVTRDFAGKAVIPYSFVDHRFKLVRQVYTGSQVLNPSCFGFAS